MSFCGHGQGAAISFLRATPDLVFLVNKEGVCLDYHAADPSRLPVPPEKFLGRKLGDVVPLEIADLCQRAIQDAIRTDQTQVIQYSIPRSGEARHFEAHVARCCDCDHALAIVRDITERKSAEEQLREQAALLDHARDAILVRDLQNRVLFWNKGAERIYGWTTQEAASRDIRGLIYREEHLAPFEEACHALFQKGEWSGHLRQKTKGGKELISECDWVLVRDGAGLPKSILAINTDITEKKALETQFLRAQRMESLGTLAGGIAHDLNNMLSPILMAIQMLQQKTDDDETQEWLATLLASAERASEVVRQVLLFARGVQGEHAPLQPRYLIREVIGIMKETLPRSIDVRFHLPQDLWNIHGDSTQLHQVLINLCLNARDAMPGGGTLSIKAENLSIDERYVRAYPDARPGRHVLITVSDTGEGIPADVIDKIFDPFFTTKEAGKGTGLGLSTALGIVKSHQGSIRVESEAEKGATFQVVLPALESESPAELATARVKLPLGRGETILVVDDEKAIQDITGATLQHFGYRVLRARDGAEALALFAQNRSEIRAVLLDMMMPYLDGPATVRALRRIDREIRIIATSGLVDDSAAVRFAQETVDKFLMKPYTADALLTTLAEVLKDKRPG
ncbi:MAG: PAS domain S-box protein [Acidobacteria bacterium]|nr:PAS domain S-box protein [Acidobacteriota bacterium]